MSKKIFCFYYLFIFRGMGREVTDPEMYCHFVFQLLVGRYAMTTLVIADTHTIIVLCMIMIVN